MSKSFLELFGSEVTFGSPTLGLVDGENGDDPKLKRIDPVKARTFHRYFVSYTVSGAFGNNVMSSVKKVTSIEDISEMQLVLRNGLGYEGSPVILSISYLGEVQV